MEHSWNIYCKTHEAAKQFKNKGFAHYESMAMILPQTDKGNSAFQPSIQTFGAVANTAMAMQPPSSLSQQQHMLPLPEPAHAQQQYMPPPPGPAHAQQQHMPPLPGPSHVPQDFLQHELQQQQQHMQLQNIYSDTQQQLPFNDVLPECMPPQNIHSNAQQQLPFGDAQCMPHQDIHNDMQQDFFRQLQQQQHMQPQDVYNHTQHWSFQQQQRQGSSTVRDTDLIAPHPPSTPLCPPTSVITLASHLTTAPTASVTRSRSSLKCKQSAYRNDASGASSEKRQKSGGGAVVYKMEAATIKTRNNTVMLVQQQETDLTNDQIVVLINLFQTSMPHSTTYLNIQRENLWKTWLAAQLKWAGHL
ncbi:hypothetical protein PILCRDRAFT_93072 [Piloderma croceum F 1598]|uniref:Uncharacterized protein n=1 Tax=Piloderma croceum (strain F 1598) TaxID=765440 RepID=A0A0C3B7W7_PILCF|nr:hypothetical protein PILCRDRAFT_93072 [Piloderma croceum F 1598]